MATLGIDIGCTSVKIALVGTPEERSAFAELAASSDLFHTPEAEGRISPNPGSPPAPATKYRRIKGSPAEATRDLLRQVLEAIPKGVITQLGVTGTGGRLVSELLDLPYENEFKAIARAMGALYPEITTVFEMGGETSKFILLETDRETGRVGIADYQTNGDCAAGTGSFMDQQANRLLYDIEDVGDIVLRRRQGGHHRRALLRVRQVGHDPRPAEGLPAARGAQGPLQRRDPQLPRHHRQGQGHRRGWPSSAAWPPTRAPWTRCARPSSLDEDRLVVPATTPGWAPSAPPCCRADETSGAEPMVMDATDRLGQGHTAGSPRAKPSRWIGSSCCGTG